LDIYSAMRLLDHMAVVCLFGFSFFETSSWGILQVPVKLIM
jgi:hypothetical protein